MVSNNYLGANLNLYHRWGLVGWDKVYITSFFFTLGGEDFLWTFRARVRLVNYSKIDHSIALQHQSAGGNVEEDWNFW